MDFEEAAVASGLVPPRHVNELLRSLKNRTFGWLVCDPSKREDRLQGDLVLELPVAVIGPDGAPKCKAFTAMVLNNACDLQPGQCDSVTVAPVLSFNHFAKVVLERKDPGKAKNFLESVRANEVDQFLYIPHCSQLPQGAVIHFDRLASMSAQVYEKALVNGSRVASLTQTGFYYLLMKLTRYLCRPESPEIVRDNPP